ncbi:hypothetical protein ABPG72_021207 [Tetrahymena utriculariae]
MLKLLYHFSTEKITIDENTSENFYRIINNVKSAKLHQMPTELNFNKANLQYLDLDYKFISQNQVNLDYSNLKSATKLQYLKMNSETEIIKSCQTPQISRKRILLKNIPTPNNPEKENFQIYSLNFFSAFKELQILNIEILGKSNIIDFIMKSQVIRKVKLALKDSIEMDYIQLLPILDYHKTLLFFSLCQKKCSPLIKFEKQEQNSIYYDLYLRDVFYFGDLGEEEEQQKITNLLNMKKMVYDFKCEDYFEFDKILQFIKKSTKLRQLTLKGFSDTGDFLPWLKEETKDSQYELFSHLLNLEELDILEIDFFFKQQLLNTLSYFIKNSRSLKNLNLAMYQKMEEQIVLNRNILIEIRLQIIFALVLYVKNQDIVDFFKCKQLLNQKLDQNWLSKLGVQDYSKSGRLSIYYQGRYDQGNELMSLTIKNCLINLKLQKDQIKHYNLYQNRDLVERATKSQVVKKELQVNDQFRCLMVVGAIYKQGKPNLYKQVNSQVDQDILFQIMILFVKKHYNFGSTNKIMQQPTPPKTLKVDLKSIILDYFLILPALQTLSLLKQLGGL